MIVEDLAAELRQRDYQVDLLSIPFSSVWDEMLEQMLAIRLMNVAQIADRLICVRTPSYLLEHPNKVVWFIHHHRGAYDLWGSPFQDIPNTPAGLEVLEAIHQSDHQSLLSAKKLFTNSKIVSERLRKFNQLPSEVLYPPLRNAESFYCRSYGDYIFYPSRIAHVKRQRLAVESMQYVTSNTKLVIAGNPDEPEALSVLQQIIEDKGLKDRVDLRGHWISEKEKTALFAEALAGMYIPFDEDSYGYPTLESLHARKPVITCTDSGGTLEIIEDGMNGLISQPEPRQLAKAIDKMAQDRQHAEQMGKQGLARLQSMRISWEFVIERLTA